MAIDRVTEKWSVQRTDQTAGENGESGTRSRMRVIQVSVTDPASDTESSVRATLGIRAGISHPEDPFLRCTTIGTTRLTPYMLEFNLGYAARGTEDDEDPLTDPPIMAWTPIRHEEEIDRDYDGRPIVTAAGEPYAENPRVLVAGRKLSISRSLPVFFEGAANFFENKVNSEPFEGWPAGTGLVMGISGELVHAEDYAYWKVTAEFEFRYPGPDVPLEETWYKRILHQGFYKVLEVPVDPDDPGAGTVKVRQRILDADGKPVTSPQLLNDDATDTVEAEDAVFKRYKVNGTANFYDMGLI